MCIWAEILLLRVRQKGRKITSGKRRNNWRRSKKQRRYYLKFLKFSWIFFLLRQLLLSCWRQRGNLAARDLELKRSEELWRRWTGQDACRSKSCWSAGGR